MISVRTVFSYMMDSLRWGSVPWEVGTRGRIIQDAGNDRRAGPATMSRYRYPGSSISRATHLAARNRAGDSSSPLKGARLSCDVIAFALGR